MTSAIESVIGTGIATAVTAIATNSIAELAASFRTYSENWPSSVAFTFYR